MLRAETSRRRVRLYVLAPLTPDESPINSSGYGFLGSGSFETTVHFGRLRPILMGFRETERVLQAEGGNAFPEKQRRTI